MHSYKNSLAYEKKQTQFADAFYLSEKFKAKKVSRINGENKKALALQKADVDVIIRLWNNTEVKVSEKYRKYDYDDVLVEMYSKYPIEKGWINKSIADRMAYFMRDKMYWIDEHALRAFCIDELFPAISNEAIDDLILQNFVKQKMMLKLDEQRFNTYLIQAENTEGNACWNTISLSIPWTLLDYKKIKYQKILF